MSRAFSRAAAIAPFALSLLLLVGANALLGSAGDRVRESAEDELMFYPSGLMVKQAMLGYETAAADIAWLRGIQYYGEHRLTDQKFALIGHVMEIVGDLDPGFIQPYVFGAFVLAQEMKEPERGLALLKRGQAANPDSWMLAFETGFLHYVCLHDYRSSATYFTWASHLPGHPEYVERFAAFVNQKAGNRAMAVLLWKRVLATGNRFMQDVAQREIRNLEAGSTP
ncbi:MAG: hypothetical protein ACRENN_02530 [Candidatus Eiseniibacteriota bacterium]